MYEVVSWLLEIFSAMFQGYCLQYFYGNFLDGRIRDRRINGLAAAALYGVLRLGAGILLPKGYGSFVTFIRLAVVMCIILAIVMTFYRVTGKIILFLVVTFTAVSEICFFLSYMVFRLENNLLRLWNWCVINGYINSIEVYDAVTGITVIGMIFLMCVVAAALLFFTMKKIVKNYREKDYAIHRTELLFILTPGLAGLMVCTLLRVTINTAESGTPELLYDRYLSLIIIVPVILLLLLFSIVPGVKLFQDMICWNREKSSRIILEKQVSSLHGSEKTIDKCEDCSGCPYKAECIKGNNCKTPLEERTKTVHVSKTFLKYRQEDLERILTDEGIVLRMNRSIQAEGSFGDLKQDMQFRRYISKGTSNVLAESILLAMAKNINKLHNKIQKGRTGTHLFPVKSA